MGALGAATIAALFAVVNITEIVLTAKAGRLPGIGLVWLVFAVTASVSLLRGRQLPGAAR